MIRATIAAYFHVLRHLPATLARKANRVEVTTLASVVESRLDRLEQHATDITDIVQRTGLRDIHSTLANMERKRVRK